MTTQKTTNTPSLQNLISAMDCVSLLKQEQELGQRLARIVPGTAAYTETRQTLIKKLGETYEAQGMQSDTHTLEKAVDNYLESSINETNPEKNPLLPLNPKGINWLKAHATLGILWAIINWAKTLTTTVVTVGLLSVILLLMGAYSSWEAQRLPDTITAIEKIGNSATSEIPTIIATQQQLTDEIDNLTAKSGLDKETVSRLLGADDNRKLTTDLLANREATATKAKQAVEENKTGPLESAQESMREIGKFYLQGTKDFQEQAPKTDAIQTSYKKSGIPQLLLVAKNDPEAKQILKEAALATTPEARIQKANQLIQEGQLKTAKANNLKLIAATLATAQTAMVDPEAIAMVKSLAQAAEQATNAGDIRKAQEHINNIRILEQTVNTDATVRIVSRKGEKSGATRFSRDVGPKPEDYAYLIVELVDSSGNALTYPVKDEETQQTKWVKIWGERVSKKAYEALKSEKMGTGRISNTQFANKPAGKLTPNYLQGPKAGAEPTLPSDAGRMTSW